MTKQTYTLFLKARDNFKKICTDTEKKIPELRSYQQKLVDARGLSPYKVETAVVYNSSLDAIKKTDDIKLLLVADNPGRKEQSAEMRSYLVGPSGKIADNFFKSEESLGINFRKNVIILNKTPIHTPRTALLRPLCTIAGEGFSQVLESTQKEMVKLLLEFYQVFKTPIWIIGYSEMKRNGIFELYTRELYTLVSHNLIDKNDIFFFRHFSMNQFTIDLHQRSLSGESVEAALKRIGAMYRDKIFDMIGKGSKRE